jgi:hypothetical protein
MFTSKRILVALCCLGVLSISSPASASPNYQCVGTVDDVAVLSDGSLAIGTYADASTPDSWIFLCNVNTPVNGGNGAIPTTICKSWQTILVTAQATNKNVRLWFGDTLSCGTHQSYVVADVIFGPALEN